MERAEFENLLKQKMGLDAVSIGSAAIDRAVQLRMADSGFRQADEYWQHLRGSDDELQALIETVVVPETWFFRDPQAFTVLTGLAAIQLAPNPTVAEQRSFLRLLSIPCSTGEEPYSIVMSLLDGGFFQQQFQVDAIDISARALAAARRGVYGTNSFRGANVVFRDRYFETGPSGYVLAERLRKQVTFLQRNLLSFDFGLQKGSYDIIFCRNLLIYFDRPTQQQAMKTLSGLLAPGGLLFVGPAEAFLASNSGFTAINQAMSFAFRKAEAKPSVPVPAAPGYRRPVRQLKNTVLRSAQDAIPKAASATANLAPGNQTAAESPALDLKAARRLADSGKLQEAAAWCNADLAKRGPSCETFYLLGLVRDAASDREGASACYQRAIYLQPAHVEALTHLALMKEAQGDFGGAARLHDRARRAESSSQRVL